MKIAIYPGSFDPLTNGHIDIIKRASLLFDKVYVAILDNPNKNTLFSVEERVEMISLSLVEVSNVIVESSTDLAVVYANKRNAKFLVRGLRATLDFEYELNIFAFNNHIDSEIDTVFLMTRLENSFISSSGVKEMAYHSASISGLVPEHVEKKLLEKFQR